MAHRGDPDWAGVGQNDGTLVAVHYGSHADDHWSVYELLELGGTR
jgi:hypothetical protein